MKKRRGINECRNAFEYVKAHRLQKPKNVIIGHLNVVGATSVKKIIGLAVFYLMCQRFLKGLCTCKLILS